MDDANAVSYINVEIRSESGVADYQARDDQAGATWHFQVIRTTATPRTILNVPVECSNLESESGKSNRAFDVCEYDLKKRLGKLSEDGSPPGQLKKIAPHILTREDSR